MALCSTCAIIEGRYTQNSSNEIGTQQFDFGRFGSWRETTFVDAEPVIVLEASRSFWISRTTQNQNLTSNFIKGVSSGNKFVYKIEEVPECLRPPLSHIIKSYVHQNFIKCVFNGLKSAFPIPMCTSMMQLYWWKTVTADIMWPCTSRIAFIYTVGKHFLSIVRPFCATTCGRKRPYHDQSRNFIAVLLRFGFHNSISTVMLVSTLSPLKTFCQLFHAFLHYDPVILQSKYCSEIQRGI